MWASLSGWINRPKLDAIFGDPRTFQIFWATFATEIGPIDLINPEHVYRLEKARLNLAALGYGKDAVNLFINECFCLKRPGRRPTEDLGSYLPGPTPPPKNHNHMLTPRGRRPHLR
jgi:hypothetical protein